MTGPAGNLGGFGPLGALGDVGALRRLRGTRTLRMEYLIAGGGGGPGTPVDGSLGIGGPGGAGGLLTGVARVALDASLPVVVGAGGAPGAENSDGVAGGDSTFLGLTAFGGGRGVRPVRNGVSGGSGSGGSNTDGADTSGGAGVPGQGHAGVGSSTINWAGASGGAGGPATGGIGVPPTAGPGVVSSITGVAVGYCKGALSSTNPTTPGSGAGGDNPGADGIVIIRYRGPQRFTGGTVSKTADGWTVHVFEADGNLAPGGD